MRYTIVTQTRGDGSRISEWIAYHSSLGFDDFQIILDGVVDDTPDILRELDVPAAVVVHRYPEEGDYHDRLTPQERQLRLREWREANAEMRAKLPHRGFDPQSVRQIERVSQVLTPYRSGEHGRGWAAHIDVDEFINLPSHATVGELLDDAPAPG